MLQKLLATLVSAGLLLTAPMALAAGNGDARRSDTAAEHAKNHKPKKAKNKHRKAGKKHPKKGKGKHHGKRHHGDGPKGAHNRGM